MIEKVSCDEIKNLYGVNPCEILDVTYYINDASMLVITSKTAIKFDQNKKPVETIYGSFSDSYFYYFKKTQEDMQ
jgi:hypothetical protein